MTHPAPAQPTNTDGTVIFGPKAGSAGTGPITIWYTMLTQAGLNPTDKSIWFDSPTTANFSGAWWRAGLNTDAQAVIGLYLDRYNDEGYKGAHPLKTTADQQRALARMKQLAPDMYQQLVHAQAGSSTPAALALPSSSVEAQVDAALHAKPKQATISSKNNQAPAKILATIYEESKKNPDAYRQLQQMLADGSSLWGKVDVNGLFDPATQTALISAMQEWQKISAFDSSLSFSDYMKKYSKDAKQKSASAVPPLSLQDPESIKQAAQSAAMTALGHGLSDDQLQQFVQQFQSAQTQAHSDAYAADATQYTEPDLSSQANAFAQSADPGGYQANQHQSYVDALVNLFSGPGATARPSITPTPKAT